MNGNLRFVQGEKCMYILRTSGTGNRKNRTLRVDQTNRSGLSFKVRLVDTEKRPPPPPPYLILARVAPVYDGSSRGNFENADSSRI